IKDILRRDYSTTKLHLCSCNHNIRNIIAFSVGRPRTVQQEQLPAQGQQHRQQPPPPPVPGEEREEERRRAEEEERKRDQEEERRREEQRRLDFGRREEERIREEQRREEERRKMDRAEKERIMGEEMNKEEDTTTSKGGVTDTNAVPEGDDWDYGSDEDVDATDDYLHADKELEGVEATDKESIDHGSDDTVADESEKPGHNQQLDGIIRVIEAAAEETSRHYGIDVERGR
ncbi:unnamed protein product, partial [Strongylus vulgaris]